MRGKEGSPLEYWMDMVLCNESGFEYDSDPSDWH